MADCKLSQEMRINGITPVDNLFISEFMLSAPGDFVKVYVYGLMQCYMGLDTDFEEIARDLAMDRERVDAAFMYWVRKGVMKKQGTHYSFEALHTVVACNAVPKCATLSDYKEFNAAMNELMAGRTLTPPDFETAYDWIEIFGMTRGCVLEMVNYAVNHKYKSGIKISFSTLNKLAMEWVEMGITTEEKAKEHINSRLIITSDASAVLKHLGQFRNPTVDEYRLLEKWKGYGFSVEALLACCAQMVYSKSPSFALLDTIVERYHAMGISTAEEIEAEKQKGDRMHDLYKEIVQRCGGFGSATKAQQEMIDELIGAGFNKQGLLYVCDYLVAMDKKGLSHTVKLAKELKEAGITDENDVCEELEHRRELTEAVKEFLSAAGFSRMPTGRDMEMYSKYMAVFNNHEIMLKAARLAGSARNRSEHLARLLSDWEARGVTTPDMATDIPPEPVKKDAVRDDYIKGDRSYTDKDLFDIFE